MNEKLNIQDVVDRMCQETGAAKRETEFFVRTLITLISESLLSDRIVKINGMGTFKLILVERRESVDVNTGEKNEIPPHYKLSFIPDLELKEKVNEPFSAFETVEINNDSAPKKPPEERIPDTVINLPEDPPVINETTKILEIENKNEINFKNKKKMRKNRKSLIVSIVIAILVILFVILSWLLFKALLDKQIFGFDPYRGAKRPVVETVVEDPVTTEAEENESEPETVKKVIDVVNLERGSWLALISLKYYGNKIFWVYLYDFNKERIKNPQRVPVGTKIEIPDPEIYGIDANSKESVNSAYLISAQLLQEFGEYDYYDYYYDYNNNRNYRSNSRRDIDDDYYSY